MSKQKYLKRTKDKGPSEFTRRKKNKIVAKLEMEKFREKIFAKPVEELNK